MGHVARERLVELEKENAPIPEQIQQASLFAGVSLNSIEARRYDSRDPNSELLAHSGGFHGRQEYVLRWLLKKFLDEETRLYPAAWRLFRSLLATIPTRNIAKILNEKNFVVVLRQALEGAVGRKSWARENIVAGSPSNDSSDTLARASDVGKGTYGTSKKRKRNGNMTEDLREGQPSGRIGEVDADLLLAMGQTVECIVQLSKPRSTQYEAFASEYIRAVIRTTSGQAAMILGSWLELCESQTNMSTMEQDDLRLSSFTEIWSSRIIGTEDSVIFSKYCLYPSLSLLSTSSPGHDWRIELETLLARDVLTSAKAAYGSSKNAEFLKVLVSDSVSRDPLLAPILFDIAIRCLPTNGSRPRRQHDTAWLQAVFETLQNSMHLELSDNKTLAIARMLQSCIEHKVVLDLPGLQSVTSHNGLAAEKTGWDLLATIIKFDANVFLIPPGSDELLTTLLDRITTASTAADWPSIADKVVDEVLVPLMCEFSRARQLPAFIHHWYEQLARFEKRRQGKLKDSKYLSAWEDDALQIKIKHLLEASLTAEQIVEIIDWLNEKRTECVGAVTVLTAGITGAVSHKEMMAGARSRLVTMAVDFEDPTKLDRRYRPRFWQLQRNTVQLYFLDSEDGTARDDHFPHHFQKLYSHLWDFESENRSLDMLEWFRYSCEVWSTIASSSRSAASIETHAGLVAAVATIFDKVVGRIKKGKELGNEKWGSRVITTKRGAGWVACAYAYYLLLEYPHIFENFQESNLLKNIIWIASATTPSGSEGSLNPWLRINRNAFPDIWMQMIQHEHVFNDTKTSSQVVGAMLECGTHINNPIEKSKGCNGFVINSLLQFPLEVFTKSNREFIVQAWPPEPVDISSVDPASISYKMAPMDPAILSLKVKMMRRPTLYDGIKFHDLVVLADGIPTMSREPEILLPIFEEFSKLTFSHVLAAIDQHKNRDYLLGTISFVEEWLKNFDGAKKSVPYTFICLVKTSIRSMAHKSASLATINILSKDKLEQMLDSFKKLLLSNLRSRLQKPKKLTADADGRCLSVLCSMDALDAIGVSPDDLADLSLSTGPTLQLLAKSNKQLATRFDSFMIDHGLAGADETFQDLLRGDVTTIVGREAIHKTATALTSRMVESEKLKLVTDVLELFKDSHRLDQLLALRTVISSCEDSRDVSKDETHEVTQGLSTAYSTLTIQLQKVKSVREFCLITETIEMILSTKARTVTQFNIDGTLASITVLCTRHAPSCLRPTRAGTIYTHLVRLVHAILSSHRLKLHGHLHLIVQTLQSLLHCIFSPSSSSSLTQSSTSFPPWLLGPRSLPLLKASHANSYARLLTLLCDPSVAAVTRPSSAASLSSATKRAKALAGQHVGVLLAAYVMWQLDGRLALASETRRALVPGWWAVLGCMTGDERRLLGEGMDSQGRAVLAGLVGEWVRWGKWGGG